MAEIKRLKRLDDSNDEVRISVCGTFKRFFESLNAVAVKIVELVIKLAPVGVFSLMAGTISNVTESNPTEILQLVGALGLYCVSVLLGLALHTVVILAISFVVLGNAIITGFPRSIEPSYS